MDMKNKFLQALTNDKGRHNELDLGECLGLNEQQTQKIISQLLDEYKIEFSVNGASEYRPFKLKTK
jgi:hypothetical protein